MGNSSSVTASPALDTIELDGIVDSMQTGDILLSQGNELSSYAIRLISKSKWSHVAMIVRNPSKELRRAYNISKKEEGNVFVLDADWCTKDRRRNGGVQLTSLRVRRSYNIILRSRRNRLD